MTDWGHRVVARLSAAAAVLGLFVVLTAGIPVLARGSIGAAEAVEAAGQPSPTVGATATPKPNPPGAQDSDPQDYGKAVWVVVAVVAVAVIVGGGTLWLVKTRRVNMDPLSPPDDPSPDESRRDTGN